MGFKTGAFLNGVNSGLSLAMKFSDMKDKGDMRKIANSTPEESTGFTVEDGQQLEGLAKAKDANGNPYYKISANEGGSYSVEPNPKAEGFGLSDYSGSREAASIEPKKVTDFLGDRTAGSLSDGQVSRRKQEAMADVVSRSDPAGGARMRRDLSLSDREDARYKREQSKWSQEDKAASDAADFKKQYTEAYGSTIYGRRMSEYAPQAEAYKAQLTEYQAQLKAGVSPEKLGPPPVEPVRPSYSIAESLADNGALLDLRVRAGKADPAEVTKYAETMQKVQEEGYVKALQLAHSGAPLNAIADAFNQSGSEKFDPRSVVSDETIKGPDGLPTRVIKFKDPQTGEVQAINTLGELDSLGKASQYYERFFKAQNSPQEKQRLSLAEIEARGEQERKTNAEKRYQGEAIGSEERKRYTQLFSDAGRRMSESQKAYNTLIKERVYANAKPGSRQEKELQDLREAIKSYGEERSLYQSLLANAGSRPDVSAPTGLGSYRKESDLKGIASGDMGADPAAIERELVASRQGLATVKDEGSRQMLQDHIGRLEAAKQSLGLSTGQSRSSEPVKISSKQEMDALPSGTRFTAPDGTTRIKR